MKKASTDENILEEKIRKNYSKLTRSSKKIAEFLLSNMEDAAFFDLSRYSRKIDVSESTVIRFAKALGYDGFPKMQEDLRSWLKSQITPVKKMEKSALTNFDDIYRTVLDSDIEKINNIKEDLPYEKIQKAANMISSGKQVYIIGYRTSYPLSYLLFMFLNQVIESVNMVDMIGGSVYDQLTTWSKNDVLVALSFPRYSRVTLEISNYAKGKGCKIIALTDSVLSPIGKIADIVLPLRCDSPLFFNSLVGCLSVINCLVGGVVLRRKQRSTLQLKKRDGIFKQLKIHLE